MRSMYQVPHVPSLSVDTVSLALWGQEDVLVVRVADRGFQGETVNALESFGFVLLVIFPVHPY